MVFELIKLARIVGVTLLLLSGYCDAANFADRRARLLRMPSLEKVELLRKQERFEQLPKAEQQRLRSLQAAIQADPQAQRLQHVMLRYHEWLKALPTAQRAALLDLPPAERLEEIKRVVKDQEREQFNDLTSKKLLPTDHEVILRWLNQLITQREDQLLALLPPAVGNRVRRLNQPERRRNLMFQLRRQTGPQLSIIDFLQVSDGDVHRLSEELSAEVRQALQQVQDEQDRLDMLRRWVAAALFSRMMPAVSDDQLMPFYDTLEPAVKEHLENLPRERMMSELRRLYVKKRFEEQGRPFQWRGREGRPSPRP